MNESQLQVLINALLVISAHLRDGGTVHDNIGDLEDVLGGLRFGNVLTVEGVSWCLYRHAVEEIANRKEK